MSQCPKCQHDLSPVDLQANRCPGCGHAWSTAPSGEANSSGSPTSGPGKFSGGKPGDPGTVPQAISGAGAQGTGLSSANEPETWDVSHNAATYDATDGMAEGVSVSAAAPKPLELLPDDIIRMSVLWGTVDDEVPSGMTIKSLEDDEINESTGTVNVEELQNADDLEMSFQADESSRTFSPLGEESAKPGDGKIGDTASSDEFLSEPSAGPGPEKDWSEASVNETFLSDEFSELGDVGPESKAPEKPAKHDTPPDSAGGSSYDNTFVSDEFLSDEHDSKDLIDEAAKTMPLSAEGDWLEGPESQTYSGDAALASPKTTEDSPHSLMGHQGDSTDKTMISAALSDDLGTGSGSAMGGRTDALGSAEYAGADAAEGTGLVIQIRQLQPQEEPESDKADYQILSLLGEGGMGKVFNARQTSIDRVVAVKMLKSKSSSRKRDQHVKFLAEAVVTGELDHPNIVPIYDVGKDQNEALFYSMKNVTGNPWLDTIHQKSAQDNLEILMSVADAVAFAHARGVVHRDLKPENVMLGEFGEVLVMDWGLAMPTDKFRKQRGIVRSSSMGGTPAYMAPEMATGPITKIGPHSDIYLLGAILFEIVTGRPPHRGKNAMKCLMSAARNKIVPTEHAGELIDIAYKAMSTDPKDRYKSVQEFQAAVRTYLAHSESITLAAVAEEDLERAQVSDSYEDYAKARFGFEESLKLWSGNKRARSSLGAARLAYAHCAMDKGDYDLAASLLDPAESTHEKLKVDIAKAREEREARQKRLEAAKRAGRVMLATLFLVVSGAAFWINTERAAAVDAKNDAVAAEQVAKEERAAAVVAKDEAEVQRQRAEGLALQEKELKEAEREAKEQAIALKDAAEMARQEADRQRQIAEKALESEKLAKQEEQKQRLLAEKQRQQALAQETIAALSAIYAEEQALYAQQKEAEAIESAKQEVLAKNKAIEAQKAEETQRLAAVTARDIAEANRIKAEANRKKAEAQQVIASLNSIMADEQRDIAVAAEEEERKAKLLALEAKLNEEREAYISKVGLAAAKIEDNAFDTARDLLNSTNPRFRNWEWGYLKNLCEGYVTNSQSSQRLYSAALIGDGQKFVVAGEEGLAEIRDIADPETVVKTLPLPSNLTVYDAAVSPNGNWIALATDDTKDGFIKIWDRVNSQWVPTSFGARDTSFRSRDEYDEKHKLGHMDPVMSVQFSQDGTKLLTASLDRSARVWEVSTGKQLARLFGTNSTGHTGFVWDAVFCPKYKKTPDGKPDYTKPLPETQIVTVSEDGTARVWLDATGRWQDANKMKLLPAFRAHQGPIYAVACSPDGQYVATGGFDHRALLWRPDHIPQISERKLYEMQINGDPIPSTPYREMIGHDGPIRSVEFGATAKEDARDLVLLTGADDNLVKVWNVDRESTTEKITPVKTFRGHGGYVRDCVFNPAGTWILSVSHDQTAKRWSLDKDAKTEVYLVNGSPLDGHEDNVDAVAFSFTKNGNTDVKKVVTASRDNTAQIYDLNQENQLSREHIVTEGHNNLIPTGVYFDNGNKLATAAFDNTARVWDVLSGTEKMKLTGTGYAGVIAVSPNGQWILTGSDNAGEAKIWDAKTGKLLKTFAMHSSEVTAVAFAASEEDDGKLLLATADARGRCSLWSWSANSSEIAEVRKFVRLKDQFAHNDRIVALRFLPDGKRLLSASHDNAVSQWNLETGAADPRLDLKHDKQVSSMDLSADGRWLVTTSFDGVIRLWDADAATIARELRPQGRMATLLANVATQFSLKKNSNETLKRAWKLINPRADVEEFYQRGGWEQGVEELLSQIPAQQGNVDEVPRKLAEQLAGLFGGISAENLLLPSTNSAAISPDARYVVATNRVDQMVHGWRLPADPAADGKLIEFAIKDGLDAWAVAFSPAKMRTDLVVLGFSDARQWQLGMNGDDVAKTPSITLNAQGEVASASFSPDGQYLVTGARDKAARVWNVKTGLGMVKLQGVHTGPVNAAVWAPQRIAGERYILTASDDKTAVLWKLTADGPGSFQAEAIRTFAGHAGSVLDAAFSPNGEWIVTVSSDKTARLWETATGNLVAETAPQGDELLCVAFADDGKRILTGSADNLAMIWSVEPSADKLAFQPILVLQGHSARVTDVAFSPLEDLNQDGRISENEEYALRAVTSSADNSVIVWDTRKPTYSEEALPKANQVLTLKRHDRPVNAVRFSPDGRYILTGSEDHRAILWPTKDWMADKLSEIQKDEKLKEQPVTAKLVGSTSDIKK